MDTGENYIINDRMFWALRRGTNPHLLLLGMVGVKMGDRFAQIGCTHAGRLGALAVKVGLSGRAVAVTPDEQSAARARKGAADAGALVDIDVAPPTALPLDAGALDLVVFDNTAGLLSALSAEDRVASIREVQRVLRPGGRVIVIGAGGRGGLAARLSRERPGPVFDPTPLLEAGRFRAVRTLAERDGLIFVEATKPR